MDFKNFLQNLMIHTIIFIVFYLIIYFFDFGTSKPTKNAEHGRKYTTSLVDQYITFILTGTLLITIGYILKTSLNLYNQGLTWNGLVNIITSIGWTYFVGLFCNEVNANKIGFVVSQFTNQPIRQVSEGFFICFPGTTRTSLEEHGENAHPEEKEITDRLFDEKVLVTLFTKDQVPYQVEITLWLRWAKNRAAEIREFDGREEGLITEVKRYAEMYAPTISKEHDTSNTISELPNIASKLKAKLQTIVGNAEEQEPIEVGDKPITIVLKDGSKIAKYLSSKSIEQLITDRSAAATITKEEARIQVYLEQGITTSSTLEITGNSNANVLVSKDGK